MANNANSNTFTTVKDRLDALLKQEKPAPEDQAGWKQLVISMALLLPEGERAAKANAVKKFYDTLTDHGAGYYASHWLASMLKSAVWRWAGGLVWAGVSRKPQDDTLMDSAGDVLALFSLWYGMSDEGARFWADEAPSEKELDSLNSVIHGASEVKARRTEPGTPIPLIWSSVEGQIEKMKKRQEQLQREAAAREAAYATQLGVRW